MNKLRTSLAVLTVTVLGAVAFAVPSAAAAAVEIGDSDFLHADGTVLRTRAGDAITLRGTNLGGWLTQEDWMSPLGEFAADRTGWSASASAGDASAAIDGSGDSYWSTQAPQAGGERLQLDLAAPTLFNRLTVDATGKDGQRPVGIEVETSDDGATWKSVGAALGVNGLTTVRFSAQIARHLRVTQTGRAAEPWAVAEINLFSDPVLHNGRHAATATSSAEGTAPQLVLDGDAATVWQTGAAQSPGQALTIDLGRNVDMDKVLFDTGAKNAGDFPRLWDAFTSWDGETWTRVASGEGTERIVIADFNGAKNGRYLKIASNGESSQWWSVAEVAIYSGNEADRGGWSVSTSVGTSAQALIDGDVWSGWTTGRPQAVGDSVAVDMGALVTINNISTDTGKNSSGEEDWARGYRLELSRDGSAWHSVATGVGSKKATTIGFPAQAARYFRLVQTGESIDRWWSIGEMTAGLHDDDFSLRRTLEERFDTQTDRSIIDAHQDTWITAADLDRIAATGLNLIRVPIGWSQFLNLDGSWRDNPWERIDWVIAEAAARGVYVLIDLHTVPGGGCPWGSCGRMGPNPNGFWGNADYQDWVADIWAKIAVRYNGNPAVAGYDLINEPLIDYDEDASDVAQKSSYYDRLYDVVRAADTDHTIYLGAFFGMGALAHPSVHGWTNVVYELHPYDMPNQKDWSAQDRLVSAELSSLRSKLDDAGVPLLYGEYSLYYNDDVWARFMAGLNAENVSWTNWTYKVRGAAADGFAYWGMYYDNASPVPVINEDDAATFRAKLSRFGTDAFSQNERFVATISKYAGGRTSYAPVEIAHDAWTASASSSASWSHPGSGIDGVNGSSWASGQAMSGDEWFQIDMGRTETVAMVTVQTAADSVWDYPRGFRLETSLDGSTWSTAATGIAYGWKRPISIEPASARYIRITQTGTAAQWWTIDQVSVLSSY